VELLSGGGGRTLNNVSEMYYNKNAMYDNKKCIIILSEMVRHSYENAWK
jgi:hypothetical protein